MPGNTTVIVTGAVGIPLEFCVDSEQLNIEQNRGIGQAICKLILSQQRPSPLTLIATSRKGDNLGFSAVSTDTKIEYASLDLSDPASITAFKDTVAGQGGVTVLINNAGVNLDAQYNAANARKTLDVNYRGTLQVCPLLSCDTQI